MYKIFITLVPLFVVPLLSLDYKVRLNENGNFVDDVGRELYFHGINMVQKSNPYYNDLFTNTRRLQYYQEWGFNFVRLGAMWPGVVPEKPGVYDETYLQTLKTIVTQLDTYGMVSLLDMDHNGPPQWLVKSFKKPFWFTKFLFPFAYLASRQIKSYAVSDAFQRLYNNEGDGVVHWGNFWKTMAEKVKGMNSVIGYELINEPWSGNTLKNPLRLLPGYAGKHNLMPAYEYLANEIRKIDNDSLIFVEPINYGVFLKSGASALGDGFDRMPNNDARRSVLSYHYYCSVLQTLDGSKFFPNWKKMLCDKVLLNDVFKIVKENKAITGGGTFLTDFGLCAPDTSFMTVNTMACDTILELADKHLQSWAYWDSAFFTKDTHNPEWSTVKLFARPYARAVSGQHMGMKFEVKTGVFNFTYKPDNRIVRPTEIFVPNSVHYPNGYNVITDPITSVLKKTNMLLVYAADLTTLQSVAITPIK